MKISLVMPCRNDSLSLLTKTLASITNQILPPEEIIIVDSSDNDLIKKTISNFNFKKIEVIYKRLTPCYAGKSLNFGISHARNNLIALLDTKTYVANDWLSSYSSILSKNKTIEVVFGSTEFKALLPIQKIQKDLLYGEVSHETVPGTVAYSNVYKKNAFHENVRNSYDILWRDIIKTKYTFHRPNNAYIFYDDFSVSFFQAIKKFFIYSFFTALTNTNQNQKDIYFSSILIFSFLLIPWWNYFLGDWSNSKFFIDDIGKKYFLVIFIIFSFFQYSGRFFVLLAEYSKTNFTLKTVMVFLGLYIVLRWNDLMAGWVESSVLYVPHITKIYVFILLIIYLISRGLIIPIQHSVSAKKLLPFYWIKLGLFGVIFDFVKIPGYILGSVILVYKRFTA